MSPAGKVTMLVSNFSFPLNRFTGSVSQLVTEDSPKLIFTVTSLAIFKELFSIKGFIQNYNLGI